MPVKYNKGHLLMAYILIRNNIYKGSYICLDMRWHLPILGSILILGLLVYPNWLSLF